MPEDHRQYRIFLSAAEVSGDSHCAGLIRTLKASDSNFEFVGVGGRKMTEAGCQILDETVGKAAMLLQAAGRIVSFYLLIRRIKQYFKENQVDLVILCDSPAFNFHIAKIAKKAGVKTLFYVAPQLWAWGGWRIEKLKNCCDRLACILPFEQEWFREKGIDATFVGNPLMDEFVGRPENPPKKYADFTPVNATIALMPGSRDAEIASLWKPIQQIAVALKRRYRGITFTTVAVDEKGKERLKSEQILGFRTKYVIASVTKAARASDISIVASGSATLQVAAVGSPMVVMYQSSRLLWHLLGRWLLKTNQLSLVNILAKEELVPEFMPHFSSVDPITETVANLLEDRDKLIQTSRELIDLVRPLAEMNTREKVAQMATEMLTEDKPETSDQRGSS